MEKHNQDEQFDVLKKFINFLLFRKVRPPKRLKDKSYRLSDKLIHFVNYIGDQGKSEDLKLIDDFFDQVCSEFITKTTLDDRAELMGTFGHSEFRKYIYITSIFSRSIIENRDNKIANTLMSEKQIPEEINHYLKNLFSNFYTYIPLDTNYISCEQYNLIIKKFGRNLDSTETMKRLFASNPKNLF